MGGILDVAEIPGFLDDQNTTSGVEVTERLMSQAFIDAWWHEFGGRQVKVKDLLDLARLHLSLNAPSDAGLKVEVGKRLAKNRDCRFGDLILHATASQRAGSNTWYLEHVAKKADGSAAEQEENK